jgi:ATP-binding cassette subfamily B protein
MGKLFSFMRQSLHAVIVIVLLLVFQAFFDFTLITSISKILTSGISKNDMDVILETGQQMLGLAFLSMCLAIIVCYFAAAVAAKIGRDLKSRIFKKVVYFSNTELNKFSTASLITRSTNDVQQVQLLIVLLLRTVVYAPILAIGGVIKILNTNASMSWILAISVVAAITTLIILFSVVFPKFNVMQKLVDRLSLITREILTGLPVIRAFSRAEHEEKRFDDVNKELTKTNLFVNRIMICMTPLLTLILNFTLVFLVWKGAYVIDEGQMLVGDLMSYVQFTMVIIMQFIAVTSIATILPRASVSAVRIDEILNTDIVVKDPLKVKLFDKAKRGEVEFKHVSFRYPGAEEDVIHDISFIAKPGQTTAIIGSTGSGKSTIVNLIPRFYDVTEGQICVGGIDIRDVSQHELREKLGYVPQKGVLFSGDIVSNILYGNQNGTVEQVKKAAYISQSTEFIEAKKGHYHSLISQGGSNVSGGQKQRLSIARAIAKNPDIYIFDDSFSALDYKTDIAVRKALKEETASSTVIIVAQRISTIFHAEQIIVLDNGRIAGIGTHKELLKSNEVYRQIAAAQLSEEELNYA